MQTAILVAIIGALATLLVAVCAHFLQQRREHRLKNLQFKLDRYADFLGGFAEIGSKHKTYEAHLKIANSENAMKVNLIASREVLQHVYSLLDYIPEQRRFVLCREAGRHNSKNYTGNT
jgi:hypothetical protein